MNLPEFLKRRSIRRLAMIPPAILLLVVGIRFLLPVNARAARVDFGPVSLEIRGTGTLESVQEVPLAFKVGGRIQDLPFDEGAPITQGQILGHLDPNDLREQLGVAQAARGVAQASIGKAEADISQARASLHRAQSDFERIKNLHAQGILSRADLDASQERLKVTEATVQAMGSVGNQAQRGESLAKGTEAIQRLAFQEGRLVSPVDGLLTRRLREPGNIVTAGTPVLTVVSTRKIWVRAWVDESDLGALQIGQVARIGLRSHPGKVFPGRVDRIGRQSDRQTHELLVDVELLELPPVFAMGQRADVQIQTRGPERTLRVPLAFLNADGSIFVDRDGRVRRVNPTLGSKGSEFVEIKMGLAAGDLVLRSPTNTSLGIGRRVTVQEGA